MLSAEIFLEYHQFRPFLSGKEYLVIFYPGIFYGPYSSFLLQLPRYLQVASNGSLDYPCAILQLGPSLCHFASSKVHFYQSCSGFHKPYSFFKQVFKDILG